MQPCLRCAAIRIEGDLLWQLFLLAHKPPRISHKRALDQQWQAPSFSSMIVLKLQFATFVSRLLGCSRRSSGGRSSRTPDHSRQSNQNTGADEASDQVAKPAAEDDAEKRENEVGDNGSDDT